MKTRLLTSAIVLLFSTTACMCDDPEGNRCAATMGCFDVDRVGCCEATTTRVSICEVCPAGMVMQSECREADCVDPCSEEGRADDELSVPEDEVGRASEALAAAIPPPCAVSMGDGCCGESSEADSCGSCPEGTVPRATCTSFTSRTSDAGAPICVP